MLFAMDERKVITAALARQPDLDLAKLSRALGRNHAYMQQYMERGVPRSLKDADKRKLAIELGISVHEFGLDTIAPELPEDFIKISEYDITLSAGGGSPLEGQNVVAEWPFPSVFIRNVLAVSPTNLIMVRVVGDSMEPTLQSGDRVMVDMDDLSIQNPGIFAINDSGTAVIKRIEKVPLSKPPSISLISDNPAHERYTVQLSGIQIIGRVIWFGRAL